MQRHNHRIMVPSSFVSFDAGGPVLLLAIASPFVLALMIVIVLLEGVLLCVMKWHPSWLNCMLYSLAANAVSTVAGCVLTFVLQAFMGSSLSADQALQLALPLLVAFVITVLLEWLILVALQPAKKREAWKPALLINIASYIVIAVFVTWGISILES
jgi:hypothetical protein